MIDQLTFRMPANIIKDLKEADPSKLTNSGTVNEATRGINLLYQWKMFFSFDTL